MTPNSVLVKDVHPTITPPGELNSQMILFGPWKADILSIFYFNFSSCKLAGACPRRAGSIPMMLVYPVYPRHVQDLTPPNLQLENFT